MELVLSFLTSKIGAIAAWAGIVALGLALAIYVVLYHVDEGKIAEKDRAIATLSAAIQTQNTSIEQYRALATAAKARLAATQKARAAEHASNAKTIANLLARPLATSPEASCTAADAAILEFAQ